jgi:colanic acid/amylovoran biosynthesis protein
MKILVTNVYSYKNKGDAAIVFALLQEIKRVFKASKTNIQTTDVENDKNAYGVDVSPTLLWLLLSINRDKGQIKQMILFIKNFILIVAYIFIYKLTMKKPSILLSKSINNFFYEVEQSDIVIACGGGYLRTESGSLKNTVLLIVTCLNFLSAYYLNKPLYLYSQSIGPVHGKVQEIILKFALNRVRIVEPREDLSVEYLKRLKIKTKIMQTTDPVFSLDITEKHSSISVDNNKENVGFTVRKWFSNELQYNQYVKAFAALIDSVSVSNKAHFYYVPQVIAANFGDDDRKVAEDVLKLVNNKEAVTLISDDLHPLEIAGFCAKLDFFVGTRMHSNIYALINHIPTLAIEYEPKTRGIMRSLDLEDYVIDIADVTDEMIIDKFNDLRRNKTSYLNILKKNILSVQSNSRKAIEYIYADNKK